MLLQCVVMRKEHLSRGSDPETRGRVASLTAVGFIKFIPHCENHHLRPSTPPTRSGMLGKNVGIGGESSLVNDELCCVAPCFSAPSLLMRVVAVFSIQPTVFTRVHADLHVQKMIKLSFLKDPLSLNDTERDGNSDVELKSSA